MTMKQSNNVSRRCCLIPILGGALVASSFSSSLIQPTLGFTIPQATTLSTTSSRSRSILYADGPFSSSSSTSSRDFLSSRPNPRNATSSLFISSSSDSIMTKPDKEDNSTPVYDPTGSYGQPNADNDGQNFFEGMLSGFWGPRLVLGAIACFYATNFPLGTIMADALPSPAAVTSARMVLAALVLSPFIGKLDPALRKPAIMTGVCTSVGYIAQSMALVDTSPATVSFLGSATVLVCPFLEWAIDKKPMSWQDAPQTWLAALLCLGGVACLELMGGGDGAALFHGGKGDLLALLQAVGFGTQVYLSERMIADKPDQALPVTATLVATAAALSGVWCVADGWMWNMPAGTNWQSFTLPGLFFEPSMHLAAMAILWTGLISTALSFFIEMNALSRVPPAQAAVILATEPMWAALFAAGLLGESFGQNDAMGGVLIVGACIVSGMKATDLHKFFNTEKDAPET